MSIPSGPEDGRNANLRTPLLMRGGYPPSDPPPLQATEYRVNEGSNNEQVYPISPDETIAQEQRKLLEQREAARKDKEQKDKAAADSAAGNNTPKPHVKKQEDVDSDKSDKKEKSRPAGALDEFNRKQAYENAVEAAAIEKLLELLGVVSLITAPLVKLGGTAAGMLTTRVAAAVATPIGYLATRAAFKTGLTDTPPPTMKEVWDAVTEAGDAVTNVLTNALATVTAAGPAQGALASEFSKHNHFFQAWQQSCESVAQQFLENTINASSPTLNDQSTARQSAAQRARNKPST